MPGRGSAAIVVVVAFHICPGQLAFAAKLAIACAASITAHAWLFSSNSANLICTLPPLAEACIDVVPKNPHNFNVDNVRVVKINGE